MDCSLQLQSLEHLSNNEAELSDSDVPIISVRRRQPQNVLPHGEEEAPSFCDSIELLPHHTNKQHDAMSPTQHAFQTQDPIPPPSTPSQQHSDPIAASEIVIRVFKQGSSGFRTFAYEPIMAVSDFIEGILGTWSIPDAAVTQFHFTNRRLSSKGRSITTRFNWSEWLMPMAYEQLKYEIEEDLVVERSDSEGRTIDVMIFVHDQWIAS